jgi:hypothetical protein
MASHKLDCVRKTFTRLLFQTSDGLIEWVAMPLGFCNARTTFQRMMNNIMRDVLHNIVMVYLDEVFVCSRTMEDHLENMLLVFQRFKEESVKLRLKSASLVSKIWSTWAILSREEDLSFYPESQCC